jgi:hypothetical protein
MGGLIPILAFPRRLDSSQAISTHAHLWITFKKLKIIISFFEFKKLWHWLKIFFSRVRTLNYGKTL